MTADHSATQTHFRLSSPARFGAGEEPKEGAPGPKTTLIGPKRMSRQQFATKIEAPANALRQGRAG